MSLPISRRHLVTALGLLPALSCQRQDDTAVFTGPRRRVADILSPLAPEQVQFRGSLGRRIDACVRSRIRGQTPDELVEPFRHRQERSCWQTEFWGKWFLSAVGACRYTHDTEWRERLGRSVHALLATQTADGYIGNYEPGRHLLSWDIWGRKYTLLGLLAWSDLTGDPAALAAARRLADHLLMEVGPRGADIVRCGLYRGMASSSVLEPIVLLYRRTGDERYLRFAEYIVGRWSSRVGPRLVEKALEGVPVANRFPPPTKSWFSWENGGKAYEMMSCYAGLIELYRESGRQQWLNSAVRTFENIRTSEINVAGSGSSRECWYGGAARQTEPAPDSMETCVTVSWMLLCTQLLRVTGDPRYADEIERTTYNALLGALTPDGSGFAKYSPLEGSRGFGEQQCGLTLNCCTANGPRGVMLLPEVAVMTSAEGPVCNLYADGVSNLKLPSGTPCSLDIRTDYPVSGQVEITLRPERPESFLLRLRIPAWSAETALTVNGERGLASPGTYAELRRVWKPGDRVRLDLDMRGRVRADGAGRRSIAVMRGPLALARDVRLGQESIDSAAALSPDDRGFVALESVPPPPGIEMALRTGDLRFCDYASAGNTWDSRSRYRVWLPARL